MKELLDTNLHFTGEKMESYRVYTDGRVVYEDDFEEDNYELDLGGGDDYEEYRIPKEICEYIVDCCSTSNKIPVTPTAAEGFAEVFDKIDILLDKLMNI